MSGLALGLILTSAFLHAYWNLLLKRAGGGPTFIWLLTTTSVVLLTPPTIFVAYRESFRFTVENVVLMSGTAVMHLVYFVVLQLAYRHGDLSLVYPLARGVGPLVSTAGAILILGERPSGLALFGVFLVISGVVLLTLQRREPSLQRKVRPAIAYGLACGLCIATYTVWDKYAVSTANIPPLVLELYAEVGISVLLLPLAARDWPGVRTLWRTQRGLITTIAILAPTSYILVLTAMQFTPLSYVASAREISILIGAILGTRFLGEESSFRRIVAAAAMVCGVIALTVG